MNKGDNILPLLIIILPLIRSFNQAIVHSKASGNRSFNELL